MSHGSRITLKGEGDQEPGQEAGDVVILLQEKRHHTFVRRGTDLHMEMKVRQGHGWGHVRSGRDTGGMYGQAQAPGACKVRQGYWVHVRSGRGTGACSVR